MRAVLLQVFSNNRLSPHFPPAQLMMNAIIEVEMAPDNTISAEDRRLEELGYQPQFKRDMSLFGVLGMSFCAIGILTGMSSAFQTGMFSGGPLGLFWGWNVRGMISTLVRAVDSSSRKICSFFMFLIALCLAEICSA